MQLQPEEQQVDFLQPIHLGGFVGLPLDRRQIPNSTAVPGSSTGSRNRFGAALAAFHEWNLCWWEADFATGIQLSDLASLRQIREGRILPLRAG